MDAKPVERFQILSLDGGGIKGLFSAAVLAAIEDDLDIRIADHFDLITGTSTGGIIALGLGLGMRPKEIVDFYVSEGQAMFAKWYGVRWLSHWFWHKYSAQVLTRSLRKCFGDRTLGQSTKRLVVTAYSLGQNDIYLFRTPHHEKLRRDFRVPAWKVGLATSAAPTYFPVCHEIDGLRLIDGGVWANNPSMVGVVEAQATLGIPLSNIVVLNVGTSRSVVHHGSGLDRGGILRWAINAAAIDAIMRGQSIAAYNIASLLLGKERIVRLNPVVADDEFSLDGAHKTGDLVALALHHSRPFMPEFADKFMPHLAPKYSPKY